MLKIIKNELDYEAALAAIDNLMDLDPDPGSPEAEELEVCTLLVQDYESRTFEIGMPDPIDAIQFRMEQQDLSQRDLVPYIGSRSKVSEVLSRKRPLTLNMIRALHSSLGIPADVLLQEHDPTELEQEVIEWERFPLQNMVARGWVKASTADLHLKPEQLLRSFFAPIGSQSAVSALYRKADHVRAALTMDKHALAAWTARIMLRALEDPPNVGYTPGTVTLDFMREVARLSWSDSGPALAREFLKRNGISLIVEPHLPRTHLDGAALMVQLGLNRPVVGLTLRHDRIDNFWFCLMHELAHVALHLSESNTEFYDDLDVEAHNDHCEQEADDSAREALIPGDVWRKSSASQLRTPEAVEDLASQLGIHPAIVAGRIRYESKSYRILHQLVGYRRVRPCFPEIDWNG